MADGTAVGVESENPDVANAGPSLTPKAFSARRAIVVSYWAVILLCLPYWWVSTTIERHTLPLGEIAEWSAKQPCPVSIDVPLSFDKTVASPREILNKLRHTTQAAGNHCLNFRIADARLADTTSFSFFRGERRELKLVGDRSLLATIDPFSSESDVILSTLLPAVSQNGANAKIKYASRYKLVFSLLNEDITYGGTLNWPFEAAFMTHIQPILSAVADISSFDVETQVQFFAPLAIRAEKTPNGSIIQEDQLKIFVNSGEWNLASSVSSDPVLQFILYVPRPDRLPMVLQQDSGSIIPLQAFSIPQWGGIVVANTSSLSSRDVMQSFSTFAAQLSRMLGIPSVDVDAANSAQLQNWHISSLRRSRTLENIRNSVSALAAISRQVDEIHNMRIPLAVQQDTRAALAALQAIKGANATEAMRQSALAFDLSKRASFNHEMLALLYFPDEHKWAVYTPLFGPIALPLLLALFREFKQYRSAKLAAKKLKTQKAR